jgi:hypothetical protein
LKITLQDFQRVDLSRCFAFVMPVPDQVRDDGSGIQKSKEDKQHWIPDQVRNDGQKLGICRPFETVSFVTMTRVEDKKFRITESLTH